METTTTQQQAKNDLTLNELLPDDKTIKLTIDGVDREFELRGVNLRDFKWMQQTVGTADLQKGLEDIGVVAKFLFRLIKNKTDLKPVVVTEYDDETGDAKQVKLAGGDLVLEGMTLEHIERNTMVLKNLFGDAMPLVEQTKRPSLADFKKKP